MVFFFGFFFVWDWKKVSLQNWINPSMETTTLHHFKANYLFYVFFIFQASPTPATPSPPHPPGAMPHPQHPTPSSHLPTPRITTAPLLRIPGGTPYNSSRHISRTPPNSKGTPVPRGTLSSRATAPHNPSTTRNRAMPAAADTAAGRRRLCTRTNPRKAKELERWLQVGGFLLVCTNLAGLIWHSFGLNC